MKSLNHTTVLATKPALAVQKQARTQADRKPPGKWTFFFLLLFTVAVYARPQDIFPSLDALHLPLVLGICSVVAYLGGLLSGNSSLYFPRELQIVVLLTLWYMAGIPFAFWRSGSLQVFLQIWVKTLVAFFLLTQSLVTLKRIRWLAWAIILSEFVVTGMTLIERKRAVWDGERLWGFNHGIFGWNYFGIAIAMTIPYLAVLFLSRRSLLRTTLIFGACLCLMWMLVLTGSRSGPMIVTLSIVLTFFLILRRSSRGRITSFVVAVILLMALAEAPQVLWTRLGTLWTNSDVTTDQVAASAEESTRDRTALLQSAIRYTLEHPLLGLGLGNFMVTNGTQSGQASSWAVTHNTFTQISSEAGIPALCFFAGLLVMVIRNMATIGKVLPADPAVRELPLMARATLVSVVSFAFGGLFANLAYDYYVFYSIAIAVGLQVVARSVRDGRPVVVEKRTRTAQLFPLAVLR
jgi:O-antigen ligase